MVAEPVAIRGSGVGNVQENVEKSKNVRAEFGDEVVESVDMENTTAETPVTSDPKHSVNAPSWNLNVKCQLF